MGEASPGQVVLDYIKKQGEQGMGAGQVSNQHS